MRNDANDDFDHVPSLRADDDGFANPVAGRARGQEALRAAQAKRSGTGPLWALIGALFIALGGLGWWSFQQLSLMEQQLVATQESFARISEEAAGRLQDITGKVVATESSANTGTEQLKLQIKQLEGKLLEQSRQQEGVAGQQSGLDKHLEQIITHATEQQGATAQLQTQLNSLSAELAAIKAAQADQGKIDAQLKSLATDIAALKKQGNPGAAIDRLEQEILVLKSQQDSRPAVSQGASNAEFDAFRGQVTRNITTLQSQIRNLQQQINARP